MKNGTGRSPPGQRPLEAQPLPAKTAREDQGMETDKDVEIKVVFSGSKLSLPFGHPAGSSLGGIPPNVVRQAAAAPRRIPKDQIPAEES